MELEVRDLAVARGGVAVLAGVNFRLAAGAALILRGPNGLGKTTLLRTLARLQPALAGEVRAPADEIVYAGHADGLKSTLSVAENLGFWQQVYGTQALQEALVEMDLGDLAQRRAGELSAGQKRRLGLARLLVTGRRIWCLDEPTVSLDLRSVALFATMVRRHLARGGMAVIATHVDLGLPEADVLDLSPFRASPGAAQGAFDEAFA